MDFFDRQEKTRRRTAVLLVYFAAAVVGTASLVYFVLKLGWFLFLQQSRTGLDPAAHFMWWQPSFFLFTFALTLGVIGISSLTRIIDLRGGGTQVAEMMGGRRVLPNTTDFYERRLLNIVEEMAISAGMTVPPVYVLSREEGINAFAAGYTPRDAVVAVTYGAMTGLTRDELQGVIAHEFSHIFNGDMRLNINLIGILYGLLIITLIGRGILQARVRGRGAGFVILTGGALLVVGSMGLFFGKLIKSAISRQREFLADASAVQFTRNPSGLAGALKKIGGLTFGSRISSPRAEEVSHMFFSEGLKSSLFSTHPPLAERIRWLEPAFNGKFEKISPESLYQAVAVSEDAPAQQKPHGSLANIYAGSAGMAAVGAALNDTGRTRSSAVSRSLLSNPDKLMSAIGAPLQEHLQEAGRLIDSIPAVLKDLARDPCSAQAVIYLLLLDGNEAVRESQLKILREKTDGAVPAELKKMLSLCDQVCPEAKLPLFELTLPALKTLSRSQYLSFLDNLRALIRADQRISVFEYVLERILICQLDPLFSGKARPGRTAAYYAFCGVEREISCVLSLFAHLSSDASAAFEKAVGNIPDNRAQFTFLSDSECSWDQLDNALDKLAGASFYIKKWVLASVLVCLMHDRKISVEEVELFRALAASLDCPVPPWLTVAALDE